MTTRNRTLSYLAAVLLPVLFLVGCPSTPSNDRDDRQHNHSGHQH